MNHSYQVQEHKYDVVVVGAGGAGLRATSSRSSCTIGGDAATRGHDAEGDNPPSPPYLSALKRIASTRNKWCSRPIVFAQSFKPCRR